MTSLTLSDGRNLEFEQQGDLAGAPVLSLHGSPGSRLSRYHEPESLVEAGIRQITYDRPGYGLSDAKPGRTVADVVPDILALLDHLGLDRVAVMGGSGGGPHALALATLAPERCSVVCCFVGVAPADAPDLDFFAGMDPENIRRFKAAQQGREAANADFGPDLAGIAERAKGDPTKLMGDMKLPEADLEVLRRVGKYTGLAMIESARQGAWGMVDDFVAIANPWGYDPRNASAPVIIEYGAHDVNVPPGHGAWLAANVPNKEVIVNTEGGHLPTPEQMLARLKALAAH